MHLCLEPSKKTNRKNMAARKPLQGVKLEVIGLLPAAGQATRVAPLPCSKELFPIGFSSAPDGRNIRPKVAAHYLLETMRRAGITKVYIVLRKGKWDIPGYFGDGSMLDINLAYLIMGSSLGPPYTLDQAYPFVENKLVAFGFPDIIFEIQDAFTRLLKRQSQTGADAVLALFPAHRSSEVDMIDLNRQGQVRSISIKPRHTNLFYTWSLAIWTPAFSLFMHRYLRFAKPKRMPKQLEISVGQVFQAAIRSGLHFDSVAFDDDTWVDIGTPDDLVKATRRTF
jgi:glucose-1-phosphate thymidylyltransferase